MEWIDDGGTGIWRRKKPEPTKPTIPSLFEPSATAATAPPQPEEALPEPTPTTDATPIEVTAAALSPHVQPTTAALTIAAQPSEMPSSSQAASTEEPSSSQPFEESPATIEGVLTKLNMIQLFLVEGFGLVHQRLKMQPLQLEKMDAQIQGVRLHMSFDDANVATIVRQHLREQQEAKEEAKRKQEEEQKQREEQAQKEAEDAQPSESPRLTLQQLNQQALE